MSSDHECKDCKDLKNGDEKIDQNIINEIKSEALPLNQKLQLIALHFLLNEKKKIDISQEKYEDQISRIFEQYYIPLYQQENEIIEGNRKLNEQELEIAKKALNQKEIDQQLNDGKPIQNYWYTVLKNCQDIASEIFDADKPALKHVTKIEYKKQENNENFSITFYFSPNEFFENEFLKKEFFMESQDNAKYSIGTEIKWKDGKDLTQKIVKKKQKNKKTGQFRSINKTETCESFFNFFNSVDIQDLDEEDDEDMKLQERMDIDLDIAQLIQEEIVKYSLEKFFNIQDEELNDELEKSEEEISSHEGIFVQQIRKIYQDDKQLAKNQKKKEKRKKAKEAAQNIKNQFEKENKEQSDITDQRKPECKQQ